MTDDELLLKFKSQREQALKRIDTLEREMEEAKAARLRSSEDKS